MVLSPNVVTLVALGEFNCTAVIWDDAFVQRTLARKLIIER